MGQARITLLIAAILLTAVACGVQGGPGEGSAVEDRSQPLYASERERLLATCPAKAQGFFAWQQELAEREGLERPVDENDDFLYPTADAAQNLINALPADQRAGGVGIDSVRDRIIVQVTYGRDELLVYLRENVEDSERITVETVRWSSEDLATFARRIEAIPGSRSWGYGSDGLDNRIAVDVTGDAGEARRKIAEVVDPCAFTVRGNVPPMRPS